MTSTSLNGFSSPRPYPPRAISASGTSPSPFPRATADDAAPKTYRSKTSTSSARPAQISRPLPPAWCLRRKRCSSTFRNFLYSGRTSVGRRVPVGARRLSACAKTLSSSRDAFIAACVAEQFRSQIQKPKSVSCRKVRCHQRIVVLPRLSLRSAADAIEQSVFEKRRDRRWLQSLSAFEEFQFNQKLRLDEIRARVSEERRCGGRSSTSRKQIIHQNNPLAFCYGIDMHFHFRLAVLQRVLRDFRSVWKLPALANRHESDSEFIGNGRSENETARINSNDLVNLSPAAALQKQID